VRIFSQPKPGFSPFPGAGRGAEESGEDSREVKTAVEAVLRFDPVSVAILMEVEGMISSGRSRLEIAEHNINPVEADDFQDLDRYKMRESR
jgi:hypothetical protein